MYQVVLTGLTAEVFESEICYHLIDVHVCRSACPALVHVNDEVAVMISSPDFLAGRGYSSVFFVRKLSQGSICEGACFLDACERPNEFGPLRERSAGNREVFNCAIGLGPAKRGRRHLSVSQSVLLYAKRRIFHCFPALLTRLRM